MPMPKKETPIQHCANCGNLLERKRFNSRLEDLTAFKKRKFCDQVCMAKAMIQEDVTLAGLRNRSMKFRAKKCSDCGTQENLQIHHMDSNPANNDPENLRTLCAACHAKWHWKNGKDLSKPVKKCKHCEKPARKNGLCNTHSSRMYRHGNPLMVRGGIQNPTSEEYPQAFPIGWANSKVTETRKSRSKQQQHGDCSGVAK